MIISKTKLDLVEGHEELRHQVKGGLHLVEVKQAGKWLIAYEGNDAHDAHEVHTYISAEHDPIYKLHLDRLKAFIANLEARLEQSDLTDSQAKTMIGILERKREALREGRVY